MVTVNRRPLTKNPDNYNATKLSEIDIGNLLNILPNIT